MTVSVYNAVMESSPGTYALVCSSNGEADLVIGKLGILKVIPGTYVYIGSAFGPGGLKSRISHHRKPSTVKHWHIDYIKPALHLEQIWYTCNLESEEHNWARMIGTLNHATIPLAGFGSSDCQCPSHLYYFPQRPCFQEFQAQLEKYLGKKPNLQLEQS